MYYPSILYVILIINRIITIPIVLFLLCVPTMKYYTIFIKLSYRAVQLLLLGRDKLNCSN